MQRNKGFTLIELLVVMAVIAVLVTMVTFAINPEKIINQSKDAKARTELNQVKAALQLYYNELKAYPAPATWEADLEPEYMKQVPNPSSITYSGGGQDYVASVAVNYQTQDDTDSATKCSQTAGAVFYICPD